MSVSQCTSLTQRPFDQNNNAVNFSINPLKNDPSSPNANIKSPNGSIGNTNVEQTEVPNDGDEAAREANPAAGVYGYNETPEPASFKTVFFRLVRKTVHFLALVIAFWVPALCIVPYSVAVIKGHVEPFLPYVSDTATLAPQAGFFAMMIDVAAVMFFIVGYYRYRMIKYKLRVEIPESDNPSSPVGLSRYEALNFLSLITVCFASLGAMAVGNFRVSELIYFHFTGASACFGPMFLYSASQMFIAAYLYKHGVESKPISMNIAAIAGGIGLLGVVIFSAMSIHQAGWAKVKDTEWRLNWSQKEVGYVWHCLATFAEWVAINSLVPLYLSLFNRMRKFAKMEEYRRISVE